MPGIGGVPHVVVDASCGMTSGRAVLPFSLWGSLPVACRSNPAREGLN